MKQSTTIVTQAGNAVWNAASYRKILDNQIPNSLSSRRFAQYSGAVAYSGRWTPGTLTNYITKNYAEPRLLIVTDPRTDSQAITEAFYANIPVIALCDTDASLKCAQRLEQEMCECWRACGIFFYV